MQDRPDSFPERLSGVHPILKEISFFLFVIAYWSAG